MPVRRCRSFWGVASVKCPRLMNYMYQSFNFRERKKLKPYYDLIANIATEELGHIELVAHTINLCVTGSTKD